MQYSGAQVVSFIVLLIGTAAIIASIATDHWSVYNIVGSISEHRGLWRPCTDGKLGGLEGKTCQNRFEVNVKENQLDVTHQDFQPWEIACLALMCASALLGILSLLFSPCCCNRCGLCLTFWVLLATLCCAAGIGLYAYQLKTENTKAFKIGDATITLGTNTIYKYEFDWSFWLAVGGGICQLLSTLGFGVSRARQHQYSHTI